jgi:translation initiation factor eIF-2B subunit epsilon
MSLTEVLKEHQERRKKDKLAVMTMVVKKSKPSPLTYQTRLGNDELLLMIDPQSKQLLHYDAVREPGSRDSLQGNSIQRHVLLDRSIFHDRPVVQLSNNLQDCHIDICSPEVLLLFTDNFDYQQLRRDFVKGLLSDEVHCSVSTEKDLCFLRGSNLV